MTQELTQLDLIKILSRTDPRIALGIELLAPAAPFRLNEASRETPDEGGLLDLGIVATLPDGREVVVGELWAMGASNDGEGISIDPVATAKALGLGA